MTGHHLGATLAHWFRRGSFLAVLCVVGLRAQDAGVRLRVDGRVNATPSIAAVGEFVAVVWGATPPGGGADVFLATSRDGGRTFSAPVQVNRNAGEARLGGELPPRVALASSAPAPEIVVAWGARSGSTVIRVARSTDGGRSFARETTLQTSPVAGDRGWHALAVDGRGAAHIVWLDHRRMAARPNPTEHDHHADGAAMAQRSSLYYARVAPNGTISQEHDVLPGVCYCCKTALAVDGHDRLVTAWRHVYNGNIRDIAFAQSRDQGASFSAAIRVSDDQWQLAGCPDDGPALAVDDAGTVHLVWPTVITGTEPTGALFYATSRDGTTFTTRQRVPTLGSRKPGHPQIGLDGIGRIVIAWDEVIDGVRQAAVVTATAADGALRFDAPRRLGAGSAAYPVLAAPDRRILTAWTDGVGAESGIRVARVP